MMPSTKLKQELKSCPHPIGTFAGVYLDMDKAKHVGIRSLLPCGSWTCPYCRQRNLKRLQYRVFEGEISKGSENIFGQKFLTLTCPGKEYRDTYTPLEAHEEMQKNFAKLIKALKKRHGGFFYLKVVEKHKSGYPHIHVLLSGTAIAHKEVKEEIESLWCHRYGMGFVWIVLIKKGFRAGIKYITKYLVKDLSNEPAENYGHIQSMGKYKRIFTASKGALVKIEKKKTDWLDTKVMLGYVGTNKNGETEIIERDLFAEDDRPADDRLRHQEAKINAFCDFVMDNYNPKYDIDCCRIYNRMEAY